MRIHVCFTYVYKHLHANIYLYLYIYLRICVYICNYVYVHVSKFFSVFTYISGLGFFLSLHTSLASGLSLRLEKDMPNAQAWLLLVQNHVIGSAIYHLQVEDLAAS